MKKKALTLLTGIIILTTIGNAQIEEIGYAFQGYAVDAEGKALGNENINVKFTITPAGYIEEHSLATDVFGVFTATVGAVTPNVFKTINYSILQSLKVEVKKTSAAVYITIHNGQMLSVPYAQYANKAKDATTATTANNGVPVGTIIAFAGSTAPPGWLACDGAPIPAVHTELIAVLGNSWGGGLPNLTNAFLRGSGSGRAVGSDQVQATAMPTNKFVATTSEKGIHNHDVKFIDKELVAVLGPGELVSEITSFGGNYSGTRSAGAHTHDVTISGGDVETRPKNKAVLYIIKY
jgi:microcystin-dependent protein